MKEKPNFAASSQGPRESNTVLKPGDLSSTRRLRIGQVILRYSAAADRFAHEWGLHCNHRDVLAYLTSEVVAVIDVSSKREQVALTQVIAIDEENERARGRFFGLGRLIGEKQRREKEKQADWACMRAEEEAKLNRSILDKLLDEKDQVAVRIETSSRQLGRLCELIEANKRGGPLVVSEKMTGALGKMDEWKKEK
jgi:hypothetical protein